MEDAWKPEPERNGSAKRLSLTRVRSYIREMEARCRPRIAIHFSTGCAAPFQGRLFADRRGESPHAVWEGRNGCVNLFTCCEMKQCLKNNARTHKKSIKIWGIYENTIYNFTILCYL